MKMLNIFNGHKCLLLLLTIVIMSKGLQAQTSYTLGTGKDYTDLATAINACTTSGTTYTLTVYDNTVTLGATATMNTNANITINVVSSASGTKRTITRTDIAGYINLSKGTLNITDIILDGDKNNYTASNAMIKVGGTNLTMGNCVLKNCKSSASGGALNVSNGTITLTNVKITENEATSGGGIYTTKTITFNGTDTINNNIATSGRGGGIYASGSGSGLTCNACAIE